ncbi:alcohol dehydrogenase catalytic domain-containing protein [Cryobacterium sp.]|jgi:threonine dehydrogenase-like Zn-dependent dehydrogenase|uniref:zinc-dependent alcohol dehydrogenase n=1 Tax=Cryobacterium sp. TaxID=1926290 RepID=UPI0026371DC4|nr:alcohol dehydrogenase catalytic domain-containing protein [Cryobacterium sp.]MCU1444499.1 dehydrogenase [Cryobacterium sp.]
MTTGLMLERDLTVRVGPVELPARAAGDVRIRPEWAGLCGSDLHVFSTGAWVDYWPAVLGHEVVGTVSASDDPAVPVGTRVVADSRYGCGDCADCARSARFCANLTWLGETRPGGYATELDVPAGTVYPVPAGLDLDVAVLAEPLAVVLRALDGVTTRPDRVLVLGCGPIGALIVTELQHRFPAAAVAVSEPQPARAEAATRLGATVVAAPAPDAYDLVIDAAGFPGAVAAAFAAVRRGGTVLVVAIGDHPIPFTAQQLVEKGVTLMGGIGFDDEDLPRALAALAERPQRYAGLVTHRVDLTAFPEFLATMPGLNTGKVIVRCQA